MSNLPADALQTALLNIEEKRQQIEMLRKNSRHDLAEVMPLVIGLIVETFGKRWKVTQASISATGAIHCYGVRVRGKKVLTLGFDIGNLHDCKIIKEGEAT